MNRLAASAPSPGAANIRPPRPQLHDLVIIVFPASIENISTKQQRSPAAAATSKRRSGNTGEHACTPSTRLSGPAPAAQHLRAPEPPSRSRSARPYVSGNWGRSFLWGDALDGGEGEITLVDAERGIEVSFEEEDCTSEPEGLECDYDAVISGSGSYDGTYSLTLRYQGDGAILVVEASDDQRNQPSMESLRFSPRGWPRVTTKPRVKMGTS